MNTAACTFEALVAAVRSHPENHQAEVHAVNLVSVLAACPGRRACVALIHPRNFSRFEAFERVLYILEGYNVTLHRYWHTSKPAFFLYAELDDPQPDPATGMVLPHPLKDEQLKRAA